MADLVLGLASSHSPQLSTPSDAWRERGERDKNNRELIGTDGIVSDYDGLFSRTNVERIEREITEEKMEERHQRNQKAISKLVDSLYKADLDILVMVGDDQQEYLQFANHELACHVREAPLVAADLLSLLLLPESLDKDGIVGMVSIHRKHIGPPDAGEAFKDGAGQSRAGLGPAIDAETSRHLGGFVGRAAVHYEDLEIRRELGQGSLQLFQQTWKVARLIQSR